MLSRRFNYGFLGEVLQGDPVLQNAQSFFKVALLKTTTIYDPRLAVWLPTLSCPISFQLCSVGFYKDDIESV